MDMSGLPRGPMNPTITDGRVGQGERNTRGMGNLGATNAVIGGWHDFSAYMGGSGQCHSRSVVALTN